MSKQRQPEGGESDLGEDGDDESDNEHDTNDEMGNEKTIKKKSGNKKNVRTSEREEIVAQNSFQVGSSEPNARSPSRRYLQWNLTGSIISEEDDDHNIIEITFNDSEKTKQPRHSDFNGFTRGALGSSGMVLASVATSSMPSTLFVKSFHNWTKNEWCLTMNKNESIECVAIGDKWMAFASSSQDLRIFSLGGLQLSSMTVPGPVVCLASSNNRLVVVYHRAPAFNGCQSLSLLIYNVPERYLFLSFFRFQLSHDPYCHYQHQCNRKTLFTHDFTVSRNHTLQWIGFDDNDDD